MKSIKLVLFFLIAIISGSILFFTLPSMNNFYFHMPHMMYGNGIFILVILSFLLLIFVFVLLVMVLQNNSGKTNIEHLKSRLALGEISIDEYEDLKKHL